ncbi:hypothetical protein [Mycolicibacterium sp. HK-90]|uniref:hypothetical protein n=1 Tax=Mycolicibacterium sp. HK-90 TaxID=3056937 RepID=UPI0026587234|nr:hypothetical protein [Mycolicibacterium sp. HK-90]WKG02658.1 hypothetical protein QU592_26190 [Mycolicibacterium sp. HK-90]
MFRASPGRLPAADARDLMGIALPPGRIVTAQEGSCAPVAWVSIEQLSEDQLNKLVSEMGGIEEEIPSRSTSFASASLLAGSGGTVTSSTSHQRRVTASGNRQPTDC